MTKAKTTSLGRRAVGQTKDAGFQIGARRTLPIAPELAWRLLTSASGLRLWLGETAGLSFTPGTTYLLGDGTRGEVRVSRHNHHARLTWQPVGWERPSTIQVRVIAAGANTTIAFHQEWLPGTAEREQRRAVFAAALDQIEGMLKDGATAGASAS